MKNNWWASFVQWFLWGIAMAAVMGWVAKSRLRARPASERYTLKHPTSTLVIGLVGAIFFFGIAIISNTVGKNQTSTVWTTLAFVFFGLASVPLIADYKFARHHISDSGIEYGRMLGQRGYLRWSEVRKVSYSLTMNWFLLESSSGTKVRISAMLLGLPEFARALLIHVPTAAIEPDTLIVLQATEQGQPPNAWG